MAIEQKTAIQELPQFPVYFETIPNDPYDAQHVFSHVACFLGYRVGFVKHWNPKEYLNVYVDSNTTYRKLLDLQLYAADFNINSILESVSLGYPTAIKALLDGNEQAFYEYWPCVKREKTVEDEVLKRCFLRAYERMLERNPLMAAQENYIAELQPLYDKLQNEGIRPIDPEAMGLMLIFIIQEIQKEHPEFAS